MAMDEGGIPLQDPDTTKWFTKEDMQEAFELGQRQAHAQVSNNRTEGYDRDEDIEFHEWIQNRNACIYCTKCYELSWTKQFECNGGKKTFIINYPHMMRPSTCPKIDIK